MGDSLIISDWKDLPTAIPPQLNSQSVPGAIATGCRPFDDLFGGEGFPTTGVVELLGLSGSGKTQLLLSIAVASAWAGKRVLFVDTSGGFNSSRLLQLFRELHPNCISNGSGSRLVPTIDELVAPGTAYSAGIDQIDVLSSPNTSSLNSLQWTPWTLLDVLTSVLNDASKDETASSAARRRRKRNRGDDVMPCFPATDRDRDSAGKVYDLVIIDSLYAVVAPFLGVRASLPRASESGTTSATTAAADVTTSGDAGIGNAAAPSKTASTVASTTTSAVSRAVDTPLSIDPVVARIGVAMKALSALGCCVIASNYPAPVTKTQPLIQRAACPSALSDVFDIIVHLSARPVPVPAARAIQRGDSESTDTAVRAEVLTRPPYYGRSPLECEFLVSQLCSAINSNSGSNNRNVSTQ